MSGGGFPIPDLKLTSTASSGASVGGGLTGSRITFGTSAPGLTAVQIAILAATVLGGVWIFKKVS